jgi:uncharacterized membrane protein (DUF2068 family)
MNAKTPNFEVVWNRIETEAGKDFTLMRVAWTLAFNATPRKELELAVTTFAYAILMGTEGIGLYFRCFWARWFTIGATSSLIPIEGHAVYVCATIST